MTTSAICTSARASELPNATQTLGTVVPSAASALERVGDVRVPQESPVVEVQVRAGDRPPAAASVAAEQRQLEPPQPARARRCDRRRSRPGEQRPAAGCASVRQSTTVLAPGAAGEGDRDQPEIGDQDRQRAQDQDGVEQASWSSAAGAAPARPAVSQSTRRRRAAQRRVAQETSIRGFCSRACMSKKRQSSRATAMPTTTRPSARAAP